MESPQSRPTSLMESSDLPQQLEEIGALACWDSLEAGGQATLSVHGKTSVGKSTMISVTSSADALDASDGLPCSEGPLNQLDCVRASRATDVSTVRVLRIPGDYNDKAVYSKIQQQARCQQRYKLDSTTGSILPLFAGIGTTGVGSEVHLLHTSSTSNRVQVYLQHAQPEHFTLKFQELIMLHENPRYVAGNMSDLERRAHEKDIRQRTAKLRAVMPGDSDIQKRQHLEAEIDHYSTLDAAGRSSYNLPLHGDLSDWLGKEVMVHGTTCSGPGCQGCNIYAGAAGIRDILTLLTTSEENPKLLLGLGLLAAQQPKLLAEADMSGMSLTLYDLVEIEQAQDAAKTAAAQLGQHLDEQEGCRRWSRLVSKPQLRTALLSAIQSSTVTIYEPHRKRRLSKILDHIGSQDNSKVRQMALREVRIHESHILYLVDKNLCAVPEIKHDVLTSACFRQLVENTMKRLAGQNEACPVSVSILITMDNQGYRCLGDVKLSGLQGAGRRRLQQLNAEAEATSTAELVNLIQEHCLHNGQRLSNREAEAVAQSVYIVCGLPALGHSLVTNRQQLEWAREESVFQDALAATNYFRFQQLLDRPWLITAQHALHQLAADTRQQVQQLMAKGAVEVPFELMLPAVKQWLLPVVGDKPLRAAVAKHLQLSAYSRYCSHYLTTARRVVDALEATMLQELQAAASIAVDRLVRDRIKPFLEAAADHVTSRKRLQQQFLAFVVEATGNSLSMEACQLQLGVLELLLDELSQCTQAPPPAAAAAAATGAPSSPSNPSQPQLSGLGRIHSVLASYLPSQVVPMVTELTQSMCSNVADIRCLFSETNQDAAAAVEALQAAATVDAAAEPPAAVAASGRATRSTGVGGGRPPLLAAAFEQLTEVVQKLFGTQDMTERKCRLAWSRGTVLADAQQKMLLRKIRTVFLQRWFKAVMITATRRVGYSPAAHGSAEEQVQAATQHLQEYVRGVLEVLISTSPTQKRQAASVVVQLCSEVRGQLLDSGSKGLQRQIFSLEHLPKVAGGRWEGAADHYGDRIQAAHHPVAGTVNALGTLGKSILGAASSGNVSAQRRAQEELPQVQTTLQKIETLIAEVERRLQSPAAASPAAGRFASAGSASRQNTQQQQQQKKKTQQQQPQEEEAPPPVAKPPQQEHQGPQQPAAGQREQGQQEQEQQEEQQQISHGAAGGHLRHVATERVSSPHPIPDFRAKAPLEANHAHLLSYARKLLDRKQSLLLVVHQVQDLVAADYAVLAVQQGWMLSQRVWSCPCAVCAAVAQEHGYPPVLLLDIQPGWAETAQQIRENLVEHYQMLYTAAEDYERIPAAARICGMYVPAADTDNPDHVAAIMELHESHILAGKLQVDDVEMLCQMLQLQYAIDIPGEDASTGVSISPGSVHLVYLPAAACSIMHGNAVAAHTHQLVQMAAIVDVSTMRQQEQQQQRQAQQAEQPEPEQTGPHPRIGRFLGSLQQQRRQLQQQQQQPQMFATDGPLAAVGAEALLQPTQHASAATLESGPTSGSDYSASAAGHCGRKRNAAAVSTTDGTRSQQQPLTDHSGIRSSGRRSAGKQHRAV